MSATGDERIAVSSAREPRRTRAGRWAALASSALLLFGVGAHAAQPGESYAVVSLIGDSITIVNHEPVTGSAIDQNDRNQVKLGDDHFDALATRVATDAIGRTSPDARVEVVAVPDHAPYGDANALFDANGTLPALLAAVKPLVRPETHYLLVLSKFRGDARLRISNGTIGSGKLTGLGFYLDAAKRLKSGATGERGRGFVAPFAYVQVTLVDLRTGAVVNSESATESTTRANVGPDANLEPWYALTAEQKVRLLDGLLTRALQRTVPRAVATT